MTSLWTDLLFLHGHLVRKEDLAWRRDAAPEPADTEVTRSSPPAPSPTAPKERGAAACA